MADRQAMARVHAQSIRETCAPWYAPEQLRPWLALIEPAAYDPALLHKVVLVAERDAADGRELAGLGILDVEERMVGAVYVAPGAMGRGVGSRLLEALEAEASGRGVAELGVKSTLNAVGFYARRGYERLSDDVHELPDGTALPCVRMAKRLVG